MNVNALNDQPTVLIWIAAWGQLFLAGFCSCVGGMSPTPHHQTQRWVLCSSLTFGHLQSTMPWCFVHPGSVPGSSPCGAQFPSTVLCYVQPHSHCCCLQRLSCQEQKHLEMPEDGIILQAALFTFFSPIPQPNTPILQNLLAFVLSFFQFWGYFSTFQPGWDVEQM